MGKNDAKEEKGEAGEEDERKENVNEDKKVAEAEALFLPIWPVALCQENETKKDMKEQQGETWEEKEKRDMKQEKGETEDEKKDDAKEQKGQAEGVEERKG